MARAPQQKAYLVAVQVLAVAVPAVYTRKIGVAVRIKDAADSNLLILLHTRGLMRHFMPVRLWSDTMVGNGTREREDAMMRVFLP